jgi:spore coat polysaccharide biosynthesis protein SpsF
MTEESGVGINRQRVVGVIQARMGSSRLPGKVLAMIGDRPLIEWTIAAFRAVPSVDDLVVATTEERDDDRLAAALQGRVRVHRGATYDVLTRCWEAVQPLKADVVVRGTADNPFVDPAIVEAQIDLLGEGFDYVGNSGWPIGVAAEVATSKALAEAVQDARDPAEREHVMPFLYSRPERYRIGALGPPPITGHSRYTVDTPSDLAFARAIADRLGHGPPTSLPEIQEIVQSEPWLRTLNSEVRQRDWHEAGSGRRG